MTAEPKLSQSPSIAIVGAGALGGYFGVRLALAGYSVRFLMRSDLAAVRYGGLRLELADGTVHKLSKPMAFGSTIAIGHADLVIIALKTTQNACLVETLPPLLHERTVLLTLQNGLGNVELLRKAFPKNPVLAGLCQIGVNRVAPGVIRSFVPGGGFVQLGAHDPDDASLLDPVATMLERANIRAKVMPSLGEAIWRKLMWNVPFNGLAIVAGGTPTDHLVNTPALRAYARDLMEELRLVANKLGFPIEESYVDKLLEFTDRLGPYRPSSLLDFLQGRELELDSIFGEPLRQGEAAGVPMPRLSALHLLIQGVKPPEEP